jgi:carbohydrate kinase (thermoresistant glucokinase family)
MIIVIMGVAGTGKTTIGRILSAELKLPFFDADDYHPPENVRKMAAGTPLNDDDRRPWLDRLSELLANKEDSGGAILACSALKEQYRRILFSKLKNKPQLVHLTGSKELIASRMQERKGHYMPVSLLDSQLSTLEAPADAMAVGIQGTPPQISAEIVRRLQQGPPS